MNCLQDVHYVAVEDVQPFSLSTLFNLNITIFFNMCLVNLWMGFRVFPRTKTIILNIIWVFQFRDIHNICGTFTNFSWSNRTYFRRWYMYLDLIKSSKFFQLAILEVELHILVPHKILL